MANYTLRFAFTAPAGLTIANLRAQLLTDAGVASGAPITSTFFEGGGDGINSTYIWVASLPLGTTGSVAFSCTDYGIIYGVQPLNPAETENYDEAGNTLAAAAWAAMPLPFHVDAQTIRGETVTIESPGSGLHFPITLADAQFQPGHAPTVDGSGNTQVNTTSIAVAVWSALTSTLTTANSVGYWLLNTLVGSVQSGLALASKQPTVAPIVDASGNTRAVDSSGNAIASKTDVQAIQNNTLCVRSVPTMMERPAAGTATYRIELLVYDDTGNMDTPDAAPTIALVNQVGTDLSARLDSATMALVSSGRYRAVYTCSTGDPTEQLVWTFSVVVGGVSRLYTNSTQVVDTIAVDFTSSDRTTLAGIVTTLGTAGAGLTALGDSRLANLDAAVSTRSTYAGGDTSGTTTLLTRVTASVGSPLQSNDTGLLAMEQTIDMNLDAKVSEGSGGTGAYSVTITITDGTNLIQNATVRTTLNNTSNIATTNSSGQAMFSLDDGTWGITITAGGYQFTPTTLVVTTSPTQTHTFTMMAVTIPSSPVGFVTGYLYCYDENGAPEPGVVIQIGMKSCSGYGASYDTRTRSEISDSTGLVSFINLLPGATYQARRGAEDDWSEITVPAMASSPYALPDILGEDG